MTTTLPWLTIAASMLLILVYELRLLRAERHDPEASARSAHRLLRAEWVKAMSKQPNSEILAVQALRNSLMSATITASTAILVLMGSVSLIASRNAAALERELLSPHLLLEVSLVATLLATYLCSAMAMRYYHHAGFVLSLPVGTPERVAREPLASLYVQQAGVLYSWSLRCFLFAAPLGIGLLNPLAMPMGALGLLIFLRLFDRVPRRS